MSLSDLAARVPVLNFPKSVVAAYPTLFLVLICIFGFFLFPEQLALLTNMVAMAIFALSLNLVLGQAGIATIGHAALYGAGAYAAGLFALRVSSDPLFGLFVGATAGTAVAFVSGAIFLRSKGLALIMLTIATSQLLLEVANSARSITGGDDGLTGFSIAPLFGRFEFDFFGEVGYIYASTVLVISFSILIMIVTSPFGLTTRAMRLDAGRVTALGGRVYWHTLIVYCIGGFFAGIAGAVTAQTTRVVSLSMLDLHTSTAALIMVVLGGSRRLSGAILGTVAYMSIEHSAATLNPYNWPLIIGLLLIMTVTVLPGGLIQLVDLTVDAIRRLVTTRDGSNG